MLRQGQRTRILITTLALAATLVLGACTFPGASPEISTPAPVQTAAPPTATAAQPPPTATPSPPPTPTPILNNTAQEIYRRVSPAVVTIVSRVRQDNRTGTSFGTGVILDRRGFIVTNNHVIEGGQDYKVIFSDGTQRDARVVGADPMTDLAVMQVDGDVPGIASFGDSNTLEPGQPVVAIGSALGQFSNTITTGIISGLHRDLERQTGPTLEGMIQTDAAINPGNSGGPLLNLQGQIIGINTAVIRQSGSSSGVGGVAEGIGFSIPSNLAKVITAQIIADGKVTRPGIGARTAAVTPAVVVEQNLQVQQGALVGPVDRNGPAGKAGLQPGDVIVAIDGKPITKDTSLSFLLLGYKPGDVVTVAIARGQERQAVQLTLGETDR